MKVLITGSYGRCGTAIIDSLAKKKEYEFTYLNRSDRPDDHPYGKYETNVADVTNYAEMAPAFEGQDAVVHLAGHPSVDGAWSDILHSNIVGMYNALEAAREHGVETFVFASTIHVMGMYERELAPALYELEADFSFDHTDPVRPDSYYGTSKSFGEDLGRYYVEAFDAPARFYALRICSVRMPMYDHPYGDAEHAVESGEYERGSDAYERAVLRMKTTWQSRRDFAHQVDRCLQDDGVRYDIFYGVSDNDRRWFDIEHACETIGYKPEDNAEGWDGPPDE